MTALSESLLPMLICDIFSLLILTYLHFSWVRKPILDTVHIMKADKIYTEASPGRELYKVKMNIVPQDYNLEVCRADHKKRPKCHTAQEVSEEVPIMNPSCNVPMGNNKDMLA